MGLKFFPAVGFLLLAVLLIAPSPQERKLVPELTRRIDGLLETKRHKATLAPCSDDGEFLRRVTLDLTAGIPSEAEARAFIDDPHPSKRVAKIDDLLATDAFSDLMSRLLADMMFPNYHSIAINIGGNADIVPDTRQRYVRNFLRWLKDHIANDVPYPKILADLVEASGKALDNPPVLYKLSSFNGEGDPWLNFANGMSQSFLGVRLGCARCHDHPFDRWEQEDYYGLAAFAVRMRFRKYAGKKENEIEDVEVYEEPKGDLTIPESGKLIRPQFIFGGIPGTNEPRMSALARFMLAGSNTQASRAFVNRMWGYLMGRGLVHPVDDFNRKNQPSHPELLEALTKDFAAHKWSIQYLVRAICNSKAYQLACGRDQNGTNAKEDYSRTLIRPMTPEQLYSALMAGTQGITDKKSPPFREYWEPFRFQAGTIYGMGMNWTEVSPLPGNTRQALFLRNSTHDWIAAPGGLASILAQKKIPPEQKVEHLFLAFLTRRPTSKEIEPYIHTLKTPGDPAKALEDVAWTLINTTEFSTRH